MKSANRIRAITISAFTVGLLSLQTAQAQEPSAASNVPSACNTIICMAGMLNGDGVHASCKSAVDDYFKIITKRKGKFSASRTARDRLKFLNQCPSSIAGGDDWASRINSAYGRLRSF